MIPRRICAVLLCFALLACFPEKGETPLRGHLHVLLAESVAPALLQQVGEFSKVYGPKGAVITWSIVPSEVAIDQFLRDTVRAIFCVRRLTTEERTSLESRAGKIAEIRVAYDAVAAVVHYLNPIGQMSTLEIRGILDGHLKRWEDLSRNKRGRGSIHLVWGDSLDVAFYLGARMRLAANVKAHRRVKSSLEILQNVVGDPAAIGFVGIDWIDSARVPAKVLEIAEPNEQADTTFRPPVETVGKYYPPHPAHIYRNYYPLKRTIYFYSKSTRGDLSSGFGSFVANKEGQRLFLQRGLVPATQPIRLRPAQ